MGERRPVREHARIVEFASTLGWGRVESQGKSATATRTVESGGLGHRAVALLGALG